MPLPFSESPGVCFLLVCSSSAYSGLSLTTNHELEPVWDDDLVLQCLFIRTNGTSGISPFFLILSPQASLHNCPSPWQLRSLQSSQRQKCTHWSYWNLHGAFSKLCSSFHICTFVGLFFFFNNTKTVQLLTPQNLTPPCLKHMLRCFPFAHHLPEALLLLSRRQVVIIPSGDENSHCSPLSDSNT